jgi:sulfite reductase (NADPH) hemoprotein beta-component
MYKYDQHDQRIVEERSRQFRGQIERRLSGEIAEGEFKPLRLQNGLYMQLRAYMLRVAIPYGLLSTEQLRMLAHISRKYDRSYAHFSTRQNIQYNWPKLQDVPAILDDLAKVQMHAIQTSGNCVRNVTSDHLGGVARDELEDPRPYAEIIRQWSTFHPEFAALPRKFKIAVTGAPDNDRTAVRFHDIGARIVKNDKGEIGFEVLAGGGLGRTPFVGQVVSPFVAKKDLLTYLEAIMRVYNQFGRRDNSFKARIKILVNAVGIDEFRRLVDDEWQPIKDSGLQLTEQEVTRVRAFFAPPAYQSLPSSDAAVSAMKLSGDRGFGKWVQHNVHAHKQPGYSAVTISLKFPGTPPGDASDTQMDAIAELADRFSFGQVVVTHAQNLVFADVQSSQLPELYAALGKWDLGAANAGKLTDVISCPGLDYCNLANARSIPLALQIMERYQDLDYLADIGDVSIKISGCINACGHHHVGNIGILGIDKQGTEFYQILLGGSHSDDASIGKIMGRAFPHEEVVDAIDRLLTCYLNVRASEDERFIDTVRRLGDQPFKEAVYGPAH